MRTVINPPMTIIVLDDSCTAVQQRRGSGRSPSVTLTQELVKGRKTWIAKELTIDSLSYPPMAKRLPLIFVAADTSNGVSGRVFQTDMLADWRVGEVTF